MKISDGAATPQNIIFIENLQDKKPVDDDLLKFIEKTVAESLKLSGMKAGCEVSLSLVDDAGIREINREYRNIDAATDVLSFPIVEMEEGKIISSEGDFDPEENALLLGDIVISLERAEKQAMEYGHSYSREVAFLTTHGVFHLLGFDHMDKEQEARMLAKQEEVLTIMGLARK